MKSVHRVTWLALSMALLVALMAACVAVPAAPAESMDDDMNEGPKMGGMVAGFVSSDPKSFDPAAIAGWDQGVIAPNLLEGLFRLSPDGREIELAIAESFDVSDDGMTWTFNIRDGAKFHNGRQITAGDFKYSFERVLNPETRSPKAWMLAVVAGAQAYQDGSADGVSGITAVDDSTLQIQLSEPLAPFKSMLASINLAVVPQEEVEKWGEDFGQNVVAAGPFTLGEWNLNQDVTLNAFEEYWNGRPYLDQLQFRFIRDENTRIVELDAGRLDVAWVPPPTGPGSAPMKSTKRNWVGLRPSTPPSSPSTWKKSRSAAIPSCARPFVTLLTWMPSSPASTAAPTLPMACSHRGCSATMKTPS